MKYLLLIVFGLGLLFVGCNSEAEEVPVDEVEETEEEKVENPSTKPVEYSAYESAKPNFENDTVETLVSNLVQGVKEDNLDLLATLFNYPIERAYPIPAIKNAKDFKKRFYTVFDDSLIVKIKASELSDWTGRCCLSSRGYISLHKESLFFYHEYDKIAEIFYHGKKEEEQRLDLIQKGKLKLQSSLRDYALPVFEFQTENYIGRVDIVDSVGSNKFSTYRLLAWKIGESTSGTPDIMVEKGGGDDEYMGGSSGNYALLFEQGNKQYRVYRNFVGPKDMKDIDFELQEDNKEVFSEPGDLINRGRQARY